MTNEEKAEILARARATLEELDAMKPYEPAAEDAEDIHRAPHNLAYEGRDCVTPFTNAMLTASSPI